MTDYQPLVSIISPAYNHEKYIADCIRSVQAQTFGNWEMIIIDDGSTDATFAIAQQYAAADSRIKAFTQQNVGIFRLAESYNFALGKSEGKYIAILECDDTWLPVKLAKQVEALEKSSGSVLCWSRAYTASADLSHVYKVLPEKIDDENIYFNNPPGIFLEKLMKTGIPALTVLIRRENLAAAGGFLQGHGLPLVDMPTLIELTMQGTFEFIGEPLGFWRIYANQVTKTHTTDMTHGMHSLFISTIRRYGKQCAQAGLTEEKTDSYFKNRLVISYSRSGRYKLIRKDFRGARKDYIYSIFHYGLRKPVWKLRSAVGLFFSFFRMNIEWLAKLIGNDSYL